MARFLREHTVLSVFSAIYILAFAALAFGKGNAEFVMYTFVVVAAAALIVYLDAWRVRIPTWLLWCFSAWGLAHMLGGNLPLVRPDGEPIVLYSLWLIPFNAPEGYLKYDQVIHAFGFFATACLCAVLLRPALREESRTRVGPFALCALGGMGAGALNEVVEFAAVLTLPETNVGGYENTGWDLVSNAVGATIGAALMWWLAKRAERRA
ncbi:MAG: hypothetical protein ACTS27_05400 [Phycisphaerales bacterium]